MLPSLETGVLETNHPPFAIQFVSPDDPPPASVQNLLACLRRAEDEAEGESEPAHGTPNEETSQRAIWLCDEAFLLGADPLPADGGGLVRAALLNGEADRMLRLPPRRLERLRERMAELDAVFAPDPRSTESLRLLTPTPIFWLGLPAPEVVQEPESAGGCESAMRVALLIPDEDLRGAAALLAERLAVRLEGATFECIEVPAEEEPPRLSGIACALHLDRRFRFGYELLVLAARGIPVLASPALAAQTLLYPELATEPAVETAALIERLADCLFSPARRCWLREIGRERRERLFAPGMVRRRFRDAIRRITSPRASGATASAPGHSHQEFESCVH